jgi:hypothetical protein
MDNETLIGNSKWADMLLQLLHIQMLRWFYYRNTLVSVCTCWVCLCVKHLIDEQGGDWYHVLHQISSTFALNFFNFRTKSLQLLDWISSTCGLLDCFCIVFNFFYKDVHFRPYELHVFLWLRKRQVVCVSGGFMRCGEVPDLMKPCQR